ncbi:MAG: hypothetical protein WC728_02605 [Elusimicrobiota bacterium]
MKKIFAVLAVTAAFWGCSKPAEEPVQKSSEPAALQVAVASLRQTAPCDKDIPLGWAASLPVPAGKDSSGAYHVLFYPVPAQEPGMSGPGGRALVRAGVQGESACTRLPGTPKELSKTRWPAQAASLPAPELEERLRGVHVQTEKVALLYYWGRKTAFTPKEIASLKRYVESFVGVAEPALLKDYYKLNPDFWEWLRGAAGVSIAKP